MAFKYVGKVTAYRGFLLGGVKTHTSTPFALREEAQSWVETVRQGNLDAGRSVAMFGVLRINVAERKRPRTIKRCNQCVQMRINGIVTHEHGCPNSK